MYYKLHKTKQGGAVLAIADEDLMGKHLKFNNTEIFVNPRFYGDKKASAEWLTKEIKSAEVISVNLIGKEAVKLGIDAGIIDKNRIIKIGKVPHAQNFVIY